MSLTLATFRFAWLARLCHRTPVHAPIPREGYQLVAWPALCEEWRTAQVLRALSVMTVRPVTLQWLVLQTGWSQSDAAQLVTELELAGCLKTMSMHDALAPVRGTGQRPRAPLVPAHPQNRAVARCAP